jgi:DNA-binding phage protein
MIIRPRRIRREVTRRYPNGKPMTTRWYLSDHIETPQDGLRQLRIASKMAKKDNSEDIYRVRLHVLTEATIGLVRHHNVADLAKATGLTQKQIREASHPKWKVDFDVMYRVWLAFGHRLRIELTPIRPVVKVAKKKIASKKASS